MNAVRRMRRLMVVAVLSTTACGIVEPCDLNFDNNMDGNWELTLINGAPIPAQGVVVTGTTHRLKAGELFSRHTRTPNARTQSAVSPPAH